MRPKRAVTTNEKVHFSITNKIIFYLRISVFGVSFALKTGAT